MQGNNLASDKFMHACARGRSALEKIRHFI